MTDETTTMGNFRSATIVPHAASSEITAKKRNNKREDTRESITVKSTTTVQQEEQVNENNDMNIYKWKIEPSMLEPLPAYHPLESSSITLRDIPTDDVTSRVSDYMRIHSITTKYSAEYPEVDCTTPTLLKFTLQLWKGGSDDDDDSTKGKKTTGKIGVLHKDGHDKAPAVILELQKRQGTSMEMQRVQHELFRAVSTGEKPVAPKDPIFDSMSGTHKDCEKHSYDHHRASFILREIYEQRGSRHASSSELLAKCGNDLTICLNLMMSYHLDQNRLGLESLNILANPMFVRTEDAIATSRCLVLGDGEIASEIRDVFVSYFIEIERLAETDVSENGEYYDSDDEEEQEYARGFHFSCMHNIALRTLVIALEVITMAMKSDKSSTAMDVVDLQSEYWRIIIEALVYNITVSSHRPQEASLSARCLSLLIGYYSPMNVTTAADVMMSVLGGDQRLTKDVLQEANCYGRLYHSNLERESAKLTGLLDSQVK